MAKFLQDHDEFDQFCALMKANEVRSYLEIGSFAGGSIRAAAASLPVGSRIVSVDKPWKASKEASLRQVLKELKQAGYDTHLISGDSMDRKIIEAARALGPYDAVFIDGDHRKACVQSDWENYGPMAKIVGFHDIARDLPKNDHGGPHEVASFWRELTGDFLKRVEFISERTRARTDSKAAYGIGAVVRQ